MAIRKSKKKSRRRVQIMGVEKVVTVPDFVTLIARIKQKTD